MGLVKKVVLFILCSNFVFATEFNFKDVSLDEFKIYGISKNIEYKSKEHRDILILGLWEEFFNSKAFVKSKSKDVLMVIYTGYKKNSFDCFIGVKSQREILGVDEKIVKKTKFNKTSIAYNKEIKMNQLWDEINKMKIKRDFKMDIEEYLISDLIKPSYNFNVYLSKK